MTQRPALVLGAGCAGLCAAWRLKSRGFDVILIEAEDHVGGLAGGLRIGGNVYEYGPHIFHTTDPEILADVKGIMGPDLIPFKRTIKIKFLGNYFQFPLSIPDVLFKLPPQTVALAALSLIYRLLEGAVHKPEVETSETVLKRFYGDVLYKIFFKDYIERVWGIPPSQFSPSFARERIPRLNLLDIVEKIHRAIRPKKSTAISGYVEKVEGSLYSTKKGFSMITDRMAERFIQKGGVIRFKTRATALEWRDDTVTSVTVENEHGKKETLACSAIVSTLPINEAAMSFSPSLGGATLQAAQSLRFRGTIFVGIQVNKPRVLPASFMYFREHVFNRITDLSHFGHDITPKNTTLLVAEVNCDPDEPLWLDDGAIKKNVFKDLGRENFLRPEDILETHIFRSRHAYPIYSLSYEKSLTVILSAFDRFKNFETAGRQGRFQYVNTHIAMKMGYEAADRLCERVKSPREN